ncbi:DsrE family protein [Sedimenticola selenatireducens]|uniref:Uncharacterized protein n=1 Tax=Sedimenticola selenatireducens TaxID=191960 RepID=A0A2N6CTN0_9GAMM|nr:DsrE family protein [Sedimenticola selenatireducens]PLX60519.1 MAG: hypothetical protein C0630_13735 [Sedimenticola selenatireducens]
MKTINHSLMALLLFFGLFTGQTLLAAEGAPHKVVIQVSTDDPRTQTIALNNAVNLQKALGQANVQIELIAYGPGLGMLTSNSKEGQRITSLAMQDIQFSACGNTMKGIEKKTGKMPALLEGVTVVEAGVLRLMELQERGYAYVRP